MRFFSIVIDLIVRIVEKIPFLRRRMIARKQSDQNPDIYTMR